MKIHAPLDCIPTEYLYFFYSWSRAWKCFSYWGWTELLCIRPTTVLKHSTYWTSIHKKVEYNKVPIFYLFSLFYSTIDAEGFYPFSKYTFTVSGTEWTFEHKLLSTVFQRSSFNSARRIGGSSWVAQQDNTTGCGNIPMDKKDVSLTGP